MPKPRVLVHDNLHLRRLVAQAIQAEGPHCDLNHLDVSHVGELSCVFEDSPFNGDISQWNTSNCRGMQRMFNRSPFNGDISNWDVAKTTTFAMMFRESAFAGDVSNWNVSSATSLEEMFYHSYFRGDLSKWRFHEHANVSRLLHNKALPQTTAPSQFHWMLAIAENAPLAPAWRKHLDECMPLVNSMDLMLMEAGHFIHRAWLDTHSCPRVTDGIPLPLL